MIVGKQILDRGKTMTTLRQVSVSRTSSDIQAAESATILIGPAQALQVFGADERGAIKAKVGDPLAVVSRDGETFTGVIVQIDDRLRHVFIELD